MTEPATSGNYIKLNRKLLEWGWYQDANTVRLFLHLLLKANWKESEFMGSKIPVGACVVGYPSLATALKLSEKNIRTAMKHLKSTGEVAVKVTNKFSIVSLINWELYQSKDVDVAGKVAVNGQSSGSQVAPSEEGKKVRRKDKTSELDFSSWPQKPSEAVLKDWMSARKLAKAPITQTVVNSFGNQLKIALENGVTVDECLTDCITRGWKGFKWDWIAKDYEGRGKVGSSKYEVLKVPQERRV